MLRALPLLLAVLLVAPALAQDREATEQRLAALRDQVAGVERQVRQTRGEEVSALRAVENLDAEIQLREELVAGYRTRVRETQAQTQTLRRSIERLETEINEAKRSYRERARHAYIHGRRNSLALILAAGSVTQMIVRARYLQQFAERRRAQVERVAQKTAELRVREQDVRTSLEATQRTLAQTEAEQGRLAQSRRDRTQLVSSLRSQRGRLESELAQRRTDARQLEGLVRDLVAEERRRAEAERRQREAAARVEAERQAEAARQAEIQRQADLAAQRAREAEQIRRAPTPRAEDPNAVRPAPPEPEPSPPVAVAPPPRETPPPRTEAAPPPPDRTVDLTGSFRQNRGRLPWPADGTVVGRFGVQTDPVTNTRIDNNGIDIATASGAPVRGVFEGTVQRIGQIPTYGTYVMVSHGEFVTFYGNLSQVSVSRGQSLRAGQAIGRAGTESSRRGTQLYFAVFRGGQPVDPMGWLGGR
ncbi:MAG: peptidoglycan DD-metalloendopeptidase family protein [Bacteroidota bacterium]